MNVQAIKEGFAIAENAVQALKESLDKLSESGRKSELEGMLKEAEGKLKEAEARIGHELGFPICKYCWPPEIMIHNNEREYVCRNCGKPMPDGASLEIPNMDDLSTW